MRRVCRPGGRVVVADTAPALSKADAFNRMEQLRDPSHVRALSPAELLRIHLAQSARLEPRRHQREIAAGENPPGLPVVEANGDADRIRQLFAESLQSDSLGVAAFRKDGEVRFSFPTVIVASVVTSQAPSR